jgi:ribonuclease D
MTLNISYRYLVDPNDVSEALRAFAGQPILGLDTETFWDPDSQQNHLSLLQLAAPTGEIIVIDALAAGITKAAPLIEDPRTMMAAHNARFDDGVLRSFGFAVGGLVDTLRLSRKALSLQSFSLASVSAHLLGVTLDKTQQRSDWRRRPLERIQLDYAALDAQISLLVFLELAERLRSQGRWEKELERARIKPPGEAPPPRPATQPQKISFEPRPLTPRERECVDELRRWRRETAEQAGLPAYMVCQDRTLEHLAIARPKSLDDLFGIFGLGAAKIDRYGVEILKRLA